VAVNPSDSAPALIALDAKFVIRTNKGERIVDAEDYFIGPDIDITRLHILKPGDLLTPFAFHPPGRARASISRKCGTGTCGIFHC
jgi:CO/xanthine dehydrogenase FAD-binding subunit